MTKKAPNCHDLAPLAIIAIKLIMHKSKANFIFIVYLHLFIIKHRNSFAN